MRERGAAVVVVLVLLERSHTYTLAGERGRRRRYVIHP